MAQLYPKDKYKYIMAQEEVSKEGKEYEGSLLPSRSQSVVLPRSPTKPTMSSRPRKKSQKQASLDLGRDEKGGSKVSSLLSVLRSPREKVPKGISISSPMDLAPASANFVRQTGQRSSTVPPRHQCRNVKEPSHSREKRSGTAATEAGSERTIIPPVVHPASPKSGASRLPSLASLHPGGGLPLRAYEPSRASSCMSDQTAKQTVFTRVAGSGLLRTPWTGAPVPYTPYQPFSPVVPITPSLVTRADRKRMKKLMAKTPTIEMVRDDNDLW